MNNLQKIICVLTMTFLLLTAAGCVQSEDAGVSVQEEQIEETTSTGSTEATLQDDYVYTNKLEDGSDEHFTRFGDVSLGNVLHPAAVDRDLGVDYSIAHVMVKPGGSIEAHLMKNPEAYYVLEGEGALYIEDVPFELSKGQLVLIPANSIQRTVNTGDGNLEFLAIDQPAWAAENEEIME